MWKIAFTFIINSYILIGPTRFSSLVLVQLKIANYLSLSFEINGRTIFKQKLNKTPRSLTFVQDNIYVPNYLNFDLVVNTLGVQADGQMKLLNASS